MSDNSLLARAARASTDAEKLALFSELVSALPSSASATVDDHATIHGVSHPGATSRVADHAHDWQMTESGYSRSWSTVIDDDEKTVTAYFNGSEDWSDEGSNDDHLECLMCGVVRPIPAGYEVIYE